MNSDRTHGGPPPTGSLPRQRPYLTLRHRDFRRLWIAQFVSLTGSQMQLVAINWHVYLLTGSPLALGFVGLTRVVPIIVLSLWGGLLADRYDRRRVMFITQLAMTLVAAGLAVLTFTGTETLWTIYTLNALSAAAIAFDGPARQALVPRLVPRQDLPAALSLNLTIFHASMICGPALAGLLIAGTAAVLSPGPSPSSHAPPAVVSEARPLQQHEPTPSAVPGAGIRETSGGRHSTENGVMTSGAVTGGLGWIYGLNALSFLAVLVSLAAMHPERGRVAASPDADESPLRALRTGFRFVFRTPIMVWTMALDFFATFFSGCMSLLPIFADRVLMVGPVGYGLLASAPAIGALFGSLYTSLFPLPRKQGRVFLWAVAAYGVATVVFGLSRSYVLSFVALAATGLADLVSTVIRQTLRQIVTPDALRGRMTSINMIFFMGGPQLGEMEAGLVASLFASVALGATVSVVIGGACTLGVVGVIAAAAPLLRNYDVEDHIDAESG